MKPRSDHGCRWIVTAMLVIALTGPAHAIAQTRQAPIRIEMPQSAPNINRVALRGDSVFFWDRFGFLGDAYAYDRRRKTFARVKLPPDVIALASQGRDVPYVDGLKLVDSLSIAEVRLPTGAPSHVVRVAESRNIALRAPRVAAEQRWRQARSLSVKPEFIADEMGPSTPTDWAPINILSFAIDSNAVWLGLDREYQLFQDLALGGLMRVDRRTLAVSVVEDTAILRTSIAQITPDGAGRYFLLADGRVAQFDPSSGRASMVPLAPVPHTNQFAFVNDTFFLAAGGIVIADARRRTSRARGFTFEIIGDSVIPLLTDSVVSPSWDFLAARGLADHLHIEPIGPWMRAALGRVKAVALEFFFSGDQQPVSIPIDSLPTDTSGYGGETLEGPTGLYVDSLRHPALRPFLRKALTTRFSYPHVEIANLLVEWADTGSIPDLQASLDITEYPSNVRIATALALLGDSAGFQWIRRALDDTLRQSASLDSAQRIHHWIFESARRVRDPANVPRLLDLLPDKRYGFGAVNALIAYESVDVMRRALDVLARYDDASATPILLGTIAGDTSSFVMESALRDSARMFARRIMVGSPTRSHEAAAAVLVRYADVSDLLHLIRALTVSESSYAAAVIALVRLAGTGVDVMPVGTGTPAQRAAAQQWWMNWFTGARATFRPAPKEVADRAVSAMYDRLRR